VAEDYESWGKGGGAECGYITGIHTVHEAHSEICATRLNLEAILA